MDKTKLNNTKTNIMEKDISTTITITITTITMVATTKVEMEITKISKAEIIIITEIEI